MIAPALVLLFASRVLAPAPQPADAPVQPTPTAPAKPVAMSAAASATHGVLISVDGLRSDALIADRKHPLLGFQRLERGAFTLNARCDPRWSITLPNHTSMITGRPVDGERGHAWRKNVDVPREETLHAARGAYVTSMFDVAHDRGFKTALIAGKTKFSVFDASYDEEHGAPDTIEADDGKDKIDACVRDDDPAAAVDALITHLSSAPRTLTLLHFAVTDLTAHVHGWDVTPGSRYLQAVGAVDAQLTRLLDAIEASDALRGHVAIVLTTDHGGGAPLRSHDQPHMWVDYVIPFVVWSGADESERERELYALNSTTRLDPGLRQPPIPDEATSALPPIRNGEAGNVLLHLLALPAIPGSTLGAKQDLRTR